MLELVEGSAMVNIILWIVGGVAGLVVLYLLFMVTGTVWTMFRGTAPKGVDVAVMAPPTASIGENFTIRVEVRNALPKRRELRSIDISESYAKGIVVRRIEPAPAESPSEPTLGTFAYSMKEAIEPGASISIGIECYAAAAGDYRGDLTVYVDSSAFHYISRPLRTVVS